MNEKYRFHVHHLFRSGGGFANPPPYQMIPSPSMQLQLDSLLCQSADMGKALALAAYALATLYIRPHLNNKTVASAKIYYTPVKFIKCPVAANWLVINQWLIAQLDYFLRFILQKRKLIHLGKGS